MIEKEVILTIGGTDFAFRVTTVAYNAYINELKPDSKVTPSVDFVRKVLVDKKLRPELDALCDQGLAVDIAGKLVETFRPEVEIVVKN